MRADPGEVEFVEYLPCIGDGTEKMCCEIGDQVIKVWLEYLVNTIDKLVQKVFPNIQNGYAGKYYVAYHAILTPKNENVDRINAQVMCMFPGTSQVYKCADTIVEDDLSCAYPTEFLNSLTLSGLPPHEMELREGSPVTLLCNLRALGMVFAMLHEWSYYTLVIILLKLR